MRESVDGDLGGLSPQSKERLEDGNRFQELDPTQVVCAEEAEFRNSESSRERADSGRWKAEKAEHSKR